jgi:hypothetical protein
LKTFFLRITLNVPHASFTGNLASDVQSVALSDGKIKMKATVSEQKLDKRPGQRAGDEREE